MSNHIEKLETCFIKLSNAEMLLSKLIQVSILQALIKKCPDYESTVAAIRPMDEDKTIWDVVSARLIKEYTEKYQESATDKSDVMVEFSRSKALVCHLLP